MAVRLTETRADRLVSMLVDFEGALLRAGATSEQVHGVTQAARQYRDGKAKDRPVTDNG